MQGQSSTEEMVHVAVVKEHFDLVGLRTQTTNSLESVQVYLASILSTLNQRATVLCGNAVDRIDALNITHRLMESWELISCKAEYFVDTFKNVGFHVHLTPYVKNFKDFFGNEVSKQAIYFGFAGLVTGGMIGLCIGYTVKQSSLSPSQYFASPTKGAPTLMKAILCSSSRRGIDGITISRISVPRIIGANEVLLQVKAMGLDNVDFRIAGGYGHSLRKRLGQPSVNEPFILGRECSGVVLEVGSQVRSYAAGDRVWVCLPLSAPIGIMSEFTVVSENYIGQKPRNISFEGAATLPYAAIVVWRQIIPQSELGPHSSKSKRVLIHLGSTSKNDGVGLLATQVLSRWGARITISTAETGSDLENGEDEELSGSGVAQMTFLHTLKSLGAETHLILPNDTQLLPDLAQRIFDVVVNTDSSAVTPLLANFLKDPTEEVIETYPANLKCKSSWSLFHNILQSTVSLVFRTKEKEEMFESIFEECRRLVEAGFVVPVVSRSFLASQYDQAFRHVSNTSNSALAHVGKSVLVFKALPSPP